MSRATPPSIMLQVDGFAQRPFSPLRPSGLASPVFVYFIYFLLRVPFCVHALGDNSYSQSCDIVYLPLTRAGFLLLTAPSGAMEDLFGSMSPFYVNDMNWMVYTGHGRS